MATNGNGKIDQYLAEEALFQTDLASRKTPAPQFNDIPDYNIISTIANKGRKLLGVSGGVKPAKLVKIKEEQMAKGNQPELDPNAAQTLMDDLNSEAQQANLDNALVPDNEDVGIPKVEGAQPVDGDQVLADFQSSEVPPKLDEHRSINLERHTTGAKADEPMGIIEQDLLNAENADDMAKVLDSVSRQLDMGTIRPHTEVVKAGSDAEAILKALDPVLTGKQTGLMNDKQAFAMRTLLATKADELLAIARQVSSGDHNPEALGNYTKLVEQVAALTAYQQNNVTETARALGQQKIVAQSLNVGTLGDINNIINTSAKRPDDIVANAELLVLQLDNLKSGKTQEITAFTKKATNAFLGASVEWWKAQILSGVPTQAVNITGNAVWNGWETYVLKSVASVFGETRKAVGKTVGIEVKDYVSIDEAQAGYIANANAVFDGVALAGRAFVKDDSIYGGTKTDTDGDIEKFLNLMMGNEAVSNAGEKNYRTMVADVVGAGSKVPFRFLTAGDEFFKTMAFKRDLVALSVRDGKKLGLEGDELIEHMNKVLENPSDEMYELALQSSRESTFTEENLGGLTGAMASGAKEMVKLYKPLEFLLPFITTPSNIAAKATELSALSIAAPKLWGEIAAGGARADMAAAKMTTGIAISVAAYSLYQQGLITGGGDPSTKGFNNLLQKEGWQANSFKVNDEYYAYDRFEPIGAAISMMANTLDRASYSKTEVEFQDMFLMAGMGLGEHMLSMPMMQGFGNVFDAVRYQSMDKLIANYAVSAKPYSGFRKGEARVGDPIKRKVSKDGRTQKGLEHYYDQLSKYLDANSREGLRPARYWDGSLQVDPSSPAYVRLGIKTGKRGLSDPVNEELIRNKFSPQEPNAIFSLGHINFSIVELDNGRGMIYDEMVKIVGDMRKEMFTKLINNNQYKEMEKGVGSRAQGQLMNMNAKAVSAGTKTFVKHHLEAAIRRTIEEDGGTDNVSEIALMFLEEGAAASFAKTLYQEYDELSESIEDLDRKVKKVGEGESGGAMPVPFKDVATPKFKPL